MLEIMPGVAIAEDELRFEVSRSGGPGGQNVNKVETRVAVLLDLERTSGLSPEQRQLVRDRLRTRVSRDGVLRVVSQKHRTQGANREAAVERLVELLRDALAPETPRVPTRPTAAARARRQRNKELRSRRKAERRTRPDVE
ncbi:MAG: alternative ribosome rescue aminoacyl-tRNA hydrolase ArfB [Thermoanaerobaculaceae bacterium]